MMQWKFETVIAMVIYGNKRGNVFFWPMEKMEKMEKIIVFST